ncbi:MAG: HAMP domain-containing histidine kinase, partial [Clostridia bacterium]|nr:HAMP domain-containing histidine kinase [Clostridia bacterium]
ARIADAQAQKSKKELVAKLSHDIKTPVASIKAVSEVGLAVAVSEKDKANYTQIIGKADQINTLVTNLFTATLEELQQLTVTPTNIESGQVKTMLENADYLHRAEIPELPECLVYADGLRLQQVFDNIFANSYKYAKTAITVSAEKADNHIDVIIQDMGGGVPQEELPVLKEKFKRGSNSANTEGAGLGLYISDYFMKEMRGGLNLENGEHGLKVTVTLLLSGKI